MSIFGGLTFGQTGIPGVHLFIFVITASVLEIKADECGCSQPWLMHDLEYPTWDTLIQELWSGTMTYSQERRTIPRQECGLG